MARPSRAEAASSPTPIRLSPAERTLVNKAARVNHQNFSEFARDALVGAASDCLDTRQSLGSILRASRDS